MQFSDESYDVEIKRKGSNDFCSSSDVSGRSFPMKVYVPASRSSSVTIDSSIKPRYAKTICSFQSDDPIYLNYQADWSLTIYDEVSSNVYKARDFNDTVGFIFGENIEFYSSNAVLFVFLLTIEMIS